MAMLPSMFGGRRSNVFDPFSLDIWDPFFEGFPFNSALANAPNSAARETSAIANTRIDWKETPEAHIFKVDLPGLKKEEVKVEVEEGRVLQISGERSREHEEKNEKWHLVERSSGKFLRGFRLPENVKMDHVKASMEDGVLTVMVPKEEEKKPEYPQPQALHTALAEDDPKADFLVELLNRALSCTELKEVFDYDHIPDDVMQWALAQTVQVATIQAPAAP